MGMIELRNTFLEMDFDERKDLDSKDKFDKYFRPVYEAALATRDGAREVLWLINTHNFNITNGKVIGFVFQKVSRFNNGIADIRKAGKNDFADYLVAVRNKWLSDLLELRNQQEHHGWTLGDIKYNLTNITAITTSLSRVNNLSVDQFARYTANRVILFIENTLVYAFQHKSKTLPINIVKIYPESRDPKNPRRFRLTPRGLDLSPSWVINFKDDLKFI